jgi:hypothetical protein
VRLTADWTAAADGPLAAQLEALAALLADPPRRHALPLPPQGALWWTLPLYLAARHGAERVVRLWFVPRLVPREGFAAVHNRRIVGLLHPQARGLCAVVDPLDAGHGQLETWSWGEEDPCATVRDDVARWAMEPSPDRVRVEAVPCPGAAGCARAAAGEAHHYDLTVRWERQPPAA